MLQSCGRQQQGELQVLVNSLRGQLEVARDQLCRDGEERSCLQALLERRLQEGRETQVLLQEKDGELQLRQQENREVINHGRVRHEPNPDNYCTVPAF